MKWFIGIVIAVVVGWVVDTLFGAPVKKWVQEQAKNVYNVIIGFFVRKKTFDNYFDVIGSDKVDRVIYELGLRPKIPLVDLLYLEFLHSLLKVGRVNKILVFPSIDLTYPAQSKEDFEEFRKNVLKVFCKYKNQICIVDPFSITISTENFLSADFLETVKFIGSSKFITFVRDRLNLRINSFRDFNKLHPEDIRLLSMYVHLVRGWIIHNYMKENELLNTPVNLGFIIWETEVDKLGFFVKLSSESQNILLTPILGKSILFGKNRPIPVFEPANTLNIFDEFPNIILKLANTNDKAVRKYIETLSTILAKNYEENIDLKIAYKEGTHLFLQWALSDGGKKLADVNKLTKKSCITLYLIYQLRGKYDDRLCTF
ncbi:MAG: hypothetical protein OEW87_15585 [Flavobacteriaceae bacterium]|nr:hypothetical protein [Flavobacteriaceae bacterium]